MQSLPFCLLAFDSVCEARSPSLALGKRILLPAIESRKNYPAAGPGADFFASRLSLRASGRLRGPEERAEAPLQRLQHFQLEISRGVGRDFPVVHVGEHGREELLVGNELHVLGSDVDASQVDRREPAQATTAFLSDPASDRYIRTVLPCAYFACVDSIFNL